ncbi:MAG: hypothetical protein HY795_00460 [Desulfovibrio sp.]|nr:hypothetical protein [Desulfovibrio sp.]MBI4958474.1 hypothetical protein [Desulfovibrio sp.]
MQTTSVRTSVRSILLTISSCLIATACSLGPAQLKGNRIDYNKSIQNSDSEELLLNLVRIKYSESPYFMQVSSISSSFSYSASLGGGGEFSQGAEPYVQYPMTKLIPSVRGSIAENPTITYSPLLGEKFVSQLLADISPSRFWFLHRAGWEMPMLLNLMVRRIGSLHNPDHYQMTDATALAQRRDFLQFVELVNKISLRGDFALLYQEPNKENPISLTMQFRFASAEEADTLEKLLGAKLERSRLQDGAIFAQVFLSESLGLPKTSIQKNDGVILPVSFRNFIGVLVYLDRGVKVPKSDLDKGIVRSFGIDEAYNDPEHFIVVENSNVPPTGALQTVRHRNTWYYIKDNDFNSKRTFGFISVLLSLQSGNVTAAVPILTLPVNR